MFRKILVPLDLSGRGAPAVEAARDLATESGGSVTLLHVIETLDLPFRELEDFYHRLEEKAERSLADAAEPLRSAGVEHVSRVEYGDRARGIVEFAEEDGHDLIVMLSHRVDPERPGAGWTTLSYKVAILAQCPVLLVK